MTNQVASYYVDHVNSNFLFRGDTPDVDPNAGFDYTCLTDAIKAAAAAKNVPLPDNFYLIDICLLQTANSGEVPSIVAEYQYFQQNPKQGQVQYWSTEGVGIDPIACLDADQLNYLVTALACWLPDPLIDRMCALRSWLEGNYDTPAVPLAVPPPPGVPVVCYVHCNGGCDRTGCSSSARAGSR